VKFPLVVEADLDERQIDRYHRHIDSDESGWHRRFTESIWRRHQHPSNAALSGWRQESDQKKRLIHFYDEYGLEGRDFVLRNMYLHLVVDLPADDVDGYWGAIARGLADGGWRCESRSGRAADADGTVERWRRGDLCAVLRHAPAHPEDLAFGARPAEGHRALDVVVRNDGYRLPDAWDRRVFEVFHRVGLRKKLAREEPRQIPAAALAEFFPAQVELGCGPSIEAGIPHLSTLHRIYGVSRADYSFVFRAEDDSLLELFRDPPAKLREMTEIYRACLIAKPTPFYRRLVDLWNRGFLVGPVITNNFDCQCADLGLPEISLRRYDWGPYYPRIDHDPRAKSLLVVGVHADRRLVQMRARERGLRVLFVDPEAYVAPDGHAITYPVEAPQRDDLFARATADRAFAELGRALGGAIDSAPR
jgi:hypothetical protein